jgi:hypothetical protein
MSEPLIFVALLFVAVISALDLWVRSWEEVDRVRSWLARRAGR